MKHQLYAVYEEPNKYQHPVCIASSYEKAVSSAQGLVDIVKMNHNIYLDDDVVVAYENDEYRPYNRIYTIKSSHTIPLYVHMDFIAEVDDEEYPTAYIIQRHYTVSGNYCFICCRSREMAEKTVEQYMRENNSECVITEVLLKKETDRPLKLYLVTENTEDNMVTSCVHVLFADSEENAKLIAARENDVKNPDCLHVREFDIPQSEMKYIDSIYVG